MTGRTVVAAPFGHSTEHCSEPLEELFDWPHLNKLHPVLAPPTAISGVPRQRLGLHCGTGEPGGGAAHRPTMLLNLERQRFTSVSTTLLASWGQWKVAGGVQWAVQPYTSRYEVLPRIARLANATCLGVSSGMWMFPFVHPDVRAMQNALRPSVTLQSSISTFMQERFGSIATNFVGVHMRLTDIGFSNSSFCLRDMGSTISLVRELQASRSLRMVALATDDFSSKCAALFFDAFPDAVRVVSGVYRTDSCSEAQFVQEVLAKSACFVGSYNSTMTFAISEIRKSERARNETKPDCSISLAAGQSQALWR